MITTIFSKTRPINYVLIALMLVMCFVGYGFSQNLFKDLSDSLIASGSFLIICCSILLISFIGIKNNLTKNNTYTILFSFLFVMIFPQVFKNINLVLSNFLLLLALRRLIAVQSLKSVKQKIFDASILIFIATLFEFWTIVYVFLVFVIILFYAASDYRNWIVPIIAFDTTVILFLFFCLQFDKSLLNNFNQNAIIVTNIDYFSNTFQNVAFAIYVTISVLFVIYLLLTYTKKPVAHQALFRFILLVYFVSVLVFAISPDKNNSFLIFTFAPLAIMASNFFENIKTYWIAETSAVLIVIAAFICFFGQL